MKSKFYYAVFIGCFWVVNAIAQKKQNIYFFKADGYYTKQKDSADLIRIIQEPDSGSVLYHVLEYYANGDIKFIGTSSTEEPVKLEGQSISYYK